MVLVNSGNDAFTHLFGRAKVALDEPNAKHGVSVTKNDSSLVATIVVYENGSRHFNIVATTCIGSGDTLVDWLNKFAALSRLRRLPPVFRNEPVIDSNLRKWTLVDPKTLEPRLVGGKSLEDTYVPVG